MARRWFITRGTIGGEIVEGPPTNRVEVVPASEYDRLQAQRDELLSALKQWRDDETKLVGSADRAPLAVLGRVER